MKLHFRTIGEGPKTLVILHGLFGSADNWQTMARNLSAHNIKVVTVDLRDHGLSPHSDNFSYESLAGDVAQLIESESLQGCIIAGHSLGGKTAMQLSISHAGLASAFIILDIGPRSYPVRHHDIIDALQHVNLNQLKSRKEVESVLANTIQSAGVRQWLMKSLYWKEKEQLAWRFNLELIANSIKNTGTATIPPFSISEPFLFIRGEQSDYITDQDADQIEKLFTNSKLLTIPNAGHWIHADAPEATEAAIFDFINSLPA